MGQPLSRSEFLSWIARGGFLAGLAGVGAAALHGSRSVEECFNENHCAACWAYSGCALPEKIDVAKLSTPTPSSVSGDALKGRPASPTPRAGEATASTQNPFRSNNQETRHE